MSKVGRKLGHFVSKETIEKIRPKKLSIITCGVITRSLRGIRNLKGNVYIVGGLITEGQTARDLDIVINRKEDIPKLKKALGKYAERAHFLLQKKEPPSPLFLKITGKEPKSVDLSKLKRGEKIFKYEYASPK